METNVGLSLKKNILWNSVGSITFLISQWLVTILVVRLSSGWDAAGLLSLVMSVSSTFSTFTNYRMNTYQVSDVKGENTLAQYLGFRVFMICFGFVLCMVYSFATCPNYSWLAIALYFAFKALGLFIDMLHGVDQLHRRLDYVGISFMLQAVTTLAAFSIVFGLSQSIEWAIVAMCACMIGVLFFYDLPKTRQFERVRIEINWPKVAFLLKRGASAVIAGIAASAIFTVTKQLLLVFHGDATLGIYSSIAAPALIVQMGAMYVYTPMLDIFARHFIRGEKKDFINLIVKVIVFVLLASVAICLLAAWLGPWVLSLLFGEQILPYTYLLVPVIIVSLCTAFLWFFGDLLFSIRDLVGNFVGNMVAFVIAIPLGVYYIYEWGMEGVNTANIIACAVGSLVLLAFLIARLHSISSKKAEKEIIKEAK